MELHGLEDEIELTASLSRYQELEEIHRRRNEQLRRANETLAKSDERFRDLFDEAPVAYVIEDLDTRIIRANRAAMRILGATPEDIPGTY